MENGDEIDVVVEQVGGYQENYWKKILSLSTWGKTNSKPNKW